MPISTNGPKNKNPQTNSPVPKLKEKIKLIQSKITPHPKENFLSWHTYLDQYNATIAQWEQRSSELNKLDTPITATSKQQTRRKRVTVAQSNVLKQKRKAEKAKLSLQKKQLEQTFQEIETNLDNMLSLATTLGLNVNTERMR